MFSTFSDGLYLNLNHLFGLLHLYQNGIKIDKEKYRDHYFHSIQCFLLGLSLYALYFKNKQNLEKEITVQLTVIFICLFFYHDLGYLYNTSDYGNRINGTIRSWLLNIDSKNNIGIERICSIFGENKIPKELIADFSRKEELNKIWERSYDEIDNLLIKEKFSIERTSSDLESHHSYESAVVLYRLVRTREFFQSASEKVLPQGTIDIAPDKSKDLFLEIIKAILLHDFKMQTKITLKNDFFACVLMIVDEIQNYGRPYQNEQFNNRILLPTKVGCKITNKNKLKLIVDENFINTLNTEVQKSYKKHSTSAVYEVLQSKIDKVDLDSVFEIE